MPPLTQPQSSQVALPVSSTARSMKQRTAMLTDSVSRM